MPDSFFRPLTESLLVIELEEWAQVEKGLEGVAGGNQL